MQERERQGLQVTVAQVIAGALAAVSAAVVASTFGLAGTLLGAAVTSVVATIAGALYTHSLEQAQARLRLRRDPRTGALEHEVLPQPAPRTIAWGWVAGAAALVFALALGTLTVLEVAVDQPVAGLVGHPVPEHAGTTVGTLMQTLADDPPPQRPAPGTPDTTPTTGVPDTAPTGTATTGAPTRPAPTTPATTPTTAAPPPPPAPARPTPTVPPAPERTPSPDNEP